MSALPNRPRAIILLLSVALFAAACGDAAPVIGPVGAPAPTATPIVQPSGVAPPEPSGAPGEGVADPTASPTIPTRPVVVKTVVPPPPIPTTWSKAKVVTSGDCWFPAATVDATGTFHIVAGCGMSVRYATSKDGKRWRATTLPHPTRRSDVEPQIAVDGSTLYVAYTRQRQTDGGCGDDGMVDVGVYYRTRTLPNGRWSAPTRLGPLGAHLQGFRVVNGVIHETYATNDQQGPIWYGSVAAGVFRSVRIPGATGASLRVGDDGRARIAYTTDSSIRYGTVTDGRLSTRTVFRSRVMQLDTPSLVLGAGDRAYMAWAVHPVYGGGCTDGGAPDVKPGTYFGTDAGGAWQVKRIAALITGPSLALDASTGRLHVVLTTDRDVRELVRRPDGTWTTARRVAGTTGMWAGVLRRDAVTGHLLLVGSRGAEGRNGNDIVALVKS